MALLSHQGSGADEARNSPAYCNLSRNESEGTLATVPDAGNPDGHDQSMAQGSRFALCQRSVGEHPLPGYGSVASGNRLLRTRMIGGVGRGREKLPLTRLAIRSLYSAFIFIKLYKAFITASWSFFDSPPIFLSIKRLSRVKNFILIFEGAFKPAF